MVSLQSLKTLKSLKSLKTLTAIAATLAIATSCTQDETPESKLPGGDGKLTLFSQTGDPQTRATFDNNSFDDGDRVGVAIEKVNDGDPGIVDTYLFKADGSQTATFTPDDDNPDLFWRDFPGGVNATAWFPASMDDYRDGADFSVQGDWSKLDFLFADKVEDITASNYTTSGKRLTFRHKTAKVKVTLTEGENITSVNNAGVQFYGYKTVESIDPATGELTGEGDSNDWITPSTDVSGDNPIALLIPQTYAAGTPFIKITFANGDEYFWKPDSELKLEGGNVYTFDIAVNGKCEVTYNLNDGTGTAPTDDTRYAFGATVTVADFGSNTPPDGKVFLTWNTASNGSGMDYKPGATFNITANTTLYAIYAVGISIRSELEAITLNDPSVRYLLLNDIDLSGGNWTSLGTPFTNSFQGVFDGGGHTIENLTAGLFGYVVNGKIRNLIVKGTITSGDDTGLAVNYINGDGTVIENVGAYGNVSATYSTGGVVGLMLGSNIVRNCYAVGNISSSVNYAGGVMGENNIGTVINCYAIGNVSGNTTGGGVLGSNQNAGRVENCAALGSLATVNSGTFFGRIIGWKNGGTTSANNYANSEMVVGLSGNTGTTSGSADDQNGADVTPSEMQVQLWWDTTLGWSFGSDASNPWKWDSSAQRPVLWFE